jgi:hypothetical protein
MDEKPKLKIKDTTVYTKDLKIALERCSEVSAAYLSILARAVNQGILLINRDPEYLSNMIDSVSRYLLENETMMIRARRLRQERTEVFGET